MPVLLDTNVLVRNALARSDLSPNRRIVRLWLIERRLQLIVSPEVVAEYLETFEEYLNLRAATIELWRRRFESDSRTTMVQLGRRFTESRDPDDNVMLATALAGKVDYLITNDRDLLELPAEFKRTLSFAIVSPHQFLKEFEQ
jgi:putative PIN family toxin of toxin-antitoxin system